MTLRRPVQEKGRPSISADNHFVATRVQRPLWPEQDSNWLITFSDLTLHLLCILLIFYVAARQREETNRAPLAQGQPAAAVESIQAVPAENPEVTVVTGRWKNIQSEMQQYVNDLGLSYGVAVAITHYGLTINLKDTFPFASGKANLLATALPVLKKIAAVAERHKDLRLKVTGHTDDVPIATSEFPSNWELSAARASRVARYLIECGIDPSRVTVQGYGSFHPLRPNTSGVNRAANRRVEIRLSREMDEKEPVP